MQKSMYFSIFINNDIQMFSHILLLPWLLPLGIAPLFTDFSTVKDYVLKILTISL